MLQQRGSLYKHFRASYRHIQGPKVIWTPEELMLVFRNIIQDASADSPQILCVLDGFDESQDVDQSAADYSPSTQILPQLADLAQQSSTCQGLKLIVLGRPAASIERVLGLYPTISVELHNQPAIETLIGDGLQKIEASIQHWIDLDSRKALGAGDQHAVRNDEISRTLKHLRDGILAKADGTIQWVVTVLRELRLQIDSDGGSWRPGELEAVIDSLPQELHKLYEELVRRLEQRLKPSQLRRARSMLMWVYSAQRPLALDELRDALAISGWSNDRPPKAFDEHLYNGRLILTQDNNWAPLEREIINLSGCLLEVVKMPRTSLMLRPGARWNWICAEDVVQVTHQTVREFLKNNGAASGSLSFTYEQCTSQIRNDSAIYFQSTDLASLLDQVKLHYSPRSSQALFKDLKTDVRTILLCIEAKPLLRYILTFLHTFGDSNDKPAILTEELQSIASHWFGQLLRDESYDKRRRNQSERSINLHRLAFQLACEQSLSSVIRYFVDSPTPQWQSVFDLALSTAAQRNDLKTFETLLVHAPILSPHASQNQVTEIAAVLGVAVEENRGDLVDMLLLHSRDLVASIVNEDGSRALHVAARENHGELIQNLLSHGSDVNHTNRWGQTALIIAAVKGHYAAIEILVQAGCDLTTRDLNLHTALYYAVRNKHPRCIKTLLSHGNVPQCLDGALEGAFDIILQHGHDAEDFAFIKAFGVRGRSHSWPSLPDFTEATRVRKSEYSSEADCPNLKKQYRPNRPKWGTFEREVFEGDMHTVTQASPRYGPCQRQILSRTYVSHNQLSPMCCTCPIGASASKSKPPKYFRYDETSPVRNPYYYSEILQNRCVQHTTLRHGKSTAGNRWNLPDIHPVEDGLPISKRAITESIRTEFVCAGRLFRTHSESDLRRGIDKGSSSAKPVTAVSPDLGFFNAVNKPRWKVSQLAYGRDVSLRHYQYHPTFSNSRYTYGSSYHPGQTHYSPPIPRTIPDYLFASDYDYVPVRPRQNRHSRDRDSGMYHAPSPLARYEPSNAPVKNSVPKPPSRLSSESQALEDDPINLNAIDEKEERMDITQEEQPQGPKISAEEEAAASRSREVDPWLKSDDWGFSETTSKKKKKKSEGKVC